MQRPSGHVPVLWDNKTPPVVPGFHGLDVDLVEKVQGMIFTRDSPNPVLLGGETGSGKTTLVKHFVRKAADLFGSVLAVPMPQYVPSAPLAVVVLVQRSAVAYWCVCVGEQLGLCRAAPSGDHGQREQPVHRR